MRERDRVKGGADSVREGTKTKKMKPVGKLPTICPIFSAQVSVKSVNLTFSRIKQALKMQALGIEKCRGGVHAGLLEHASQLSEICCQ